MERPAGRPRRLTRSATASATVGGSSGRGVVTDSDQMDMVNLGRQVRALREKRGLSLRTLAQRVDVTASFLSQLIIACGKKLK